MDDEEIPMTVHIHRNSDGMVRVYSPDDWGWFNDYQWTDGNFGCDCNRYLFFQRAADEDDEDEYPCGDCLYGVTIYERGTIRVLFDDTKQRLENYEYTTRKQRP